MQIRRIKVKAGSGGEAQQVTPPDLSVIHGDQTNTRITNLSASLSVELFDHEGGKLGEGRVLAHGESYEYASGQEVLYGRAASGEPELLVEAGHGPFGVHPGESAARLVPLAQGQSAAMVAGKITIASAAVTAKGAILLTTEGGTAIGASVVSREVGVSFSVEATATSTDKINWAVYPE